MNTITMAARLTLSTADSMPHPPAYKYQTTDYRDITLQVIQTGTEFGCIAHYQMCVQTQWNMHVACTAFQVFDVTARTNHYVVPDFRSSY